MRIVKRKHIIAIILSIFFLANHCQLKKNEDTHGINFLKNRAAKINVDKSNVNDVYEVFGYPHTYSFKNQNRLIYFERTIVTRSIYRLGKKKLSANNILVLDFDNKGILISKKIYDKSKMQKIDFSENETKSNIGEQSFVNKFLQSMRAKMYNK